MGADRCGRRRRVAGVTDSSIVDTLCQEAVDFYDKGKYHEAKASMTRAYAAFERLEVKDKAKRVGYLRVLSNISDKLQENDKTIEYATEVANHALTDDDRTFAYGLLASACDEKGEEHEWNEKEIQCYEKALAIQLKTLGAEHPDIATSYNNIGSAYRKEGECDKAVGYYEQALAIQIKVLGLEHRAVGMSYGNIGFAYRKKKGDKKKAMAYLLKTLGWQHPNTKAVEECIRKLHSPSPEHKLPHQGILGTPANTPANIAERWESDIAELQQENWEDHLSGPDNYYP
jgi:tetratricopeptide (TPR) repeat protein